MRRLEGPELAAYDVLPPFMALRVRVQRIPVLAPGASGMTLGRFVLVTHDDDRSGERELMAHELVHVRQYAEAGGLVRFLWRYGRDYLTQLRIHRRHRAAYLAIPAEVAARGEAAAWAARRRDRHPI